MEKLTLKNFLNINSIELDLAKINIVIGTQASGKSIIAKLIYFFQNFFVEYRISILKSQNEGEFYQTIIKRFQEIFPDYTWNSQEFEIGYKINDYYINIYTKPVPENKYKIFLKYSDYLVKIRETLISEFRQNISEENNIKSPREYLEEIFSKHILRGQDMSTLDFPTFIPAGRSFFAFLQNNIFSLLSNNIPIDYFLQEFGSNYEQIKKTYPLSIDLCQENDSINDLIQKIIMGNYLHENGQDWISMNDERKINLLNSSSGQQEALPMVLILAVLPFSTSSNRTFIIEEPEAHLFPTSQKHIVSLISLVFNATHKKHKFFIATHSPYTLTAFNNLIQAGNALKTIKAKTEQNNLLENLFKLVPENEMLDIKDIGAYTLKNGTLESIINEENNWIDTNIIDDVSNEFSNTFEKLIELEIGE